MGSASGLGREREERVLGVDVGGGRRGGGGGGGGVYG